MQSAKKPRERGSEQALDREKGLRSMQTETFSRNAEIATSASESPYREFQGATAQTWDGRIDSNGGFALQEDVKFEPSSAGGQLFSLTIPDKSTDR